MRGKGDEDHPEHAPDPIEEALAGRPGARTGLYAAHCDAVRAFFTKRLPSEDAKDAQQEVFVRLLEALARRRVPAGDRFRPWLFGLARHVLADFYRRQEELPAPTEQGLSDPATPAHTAERRELTRQIRQAVADLPEELRVTFVMRIWEERSAAEVAQRLGIARQTVYARVWRARQRIVARLEKDLR